MKNYTDHSVVTFVKLKNVSHEGNASLVNRRELSEAAVNAILDKMTKYIVILRKLIN